MPKPSLPPAPLDPLQHSLPRSLPTAICLMGPTAANKTALALQLQQQLPVDIISVDSALVYRGMDIGTAKPTLQQRQLAPHRLIDIRDPRQPYSAAEFRLDALQAMAESVAAHRIPLLVGGTMLYFKVLVQGLACLPAADAAVRLRLQQLAAKQGWPALHQQLAQHDPRAAARIHPNDSQRLSRALEVCWLTGSNLTDLTQQSAMLPPPYRFLHFALAPADRAQLHCRIEQRFHQIIANGFEQEVRTLWQRGDLRADLPAMRCVGYRQMQCYLQREINYQQMIEQGICATRQLAKRQMVWLRRWPNLQWLDSHKLPDALQCIMQAVNH